MVCSNLDTCVYCRDKSASYAVPPPAHRAVSARCSVSRLAHASHSAGHRVGPSRAVPDFTRLCPTAGAVPPARGCHTASSVSASVAVSRRPEQVPRRPSPARVPEKGGHSSADLCNMTPLGRPTEAETEARRAESVTRDGRVSCPPDDARNTP